LEGNVARTREKRSAHRVLVGRPEGKKELRKPRRKWEDTIKIDFRETGWVVMDWIHLAEERNQWWALVDTVMKLRLP
jgi:hypothetical protein